MTITTTIHFKTIFTSDGLPAARCDPTMRRIKRPVLTTEIRDLVTCGNCLAVMRHQVKRYNGSGGKPAYKKVK